MGARSPPPSSNEGWVRNPITSSFPVLPSDPRDPRPGNGSVPGEGVRRVADRAGGGGAGGDRGGDRIQGQAQEVVGSRPSAGTPRCGYREVRRRAWGRSAVLPSTEM